jgi:6-pyruvoyltetrahydropterin/6-carboxytetrahydropterin synthase
VRSPLSALRMFRITKHIEFCYGHRLLNYAGKCRHLHGHNGRAEIVLEGTELDERGMVVDFSDVKKHLARWIDDQLDHRMILNRQDPAVEILERMGEPLYLIDDNPTAENIARIIFEQARRMDMPVTEISLWESSSSCATYRPPG